MPPVQMDIRKKRAAILREKGKQQLQKFLAENLNKDVQVIVEKGNTGHTENFAPVKLSAEYPPGTLVNMRTHAIDGEHLTGTTEKNT
jgi:threonylcarbamoyladenosine tRNA methylthiotransferase MtaB